MSANLRSLVRSTLLGSLATLAGGPPAEASPTSADGLPIEPPTLPSSSAGTVVLKVARPRLVLVMRSNASPYLETSHRSHRSHSSHQSHYSSSSQPSGQKPPPPPPASKQPAQSASTLGSRVLVKDMKGPDVRELILLLYAKGFLRNASDSTTDEFTSDVEKAVKKFQESNDMVANGRVNAAMVVLLKTP